MQTTPAAPPHNVPAPFSSFVGRLQERREVAQCLRDQRLVTLVGTPGVGKTRLALEVAADVVADYPGGVWVVELAPVADAALIPQAIASTLSVRERVPDDLLETLADELGDKEALLVVDNCEHLIGASAVAVDRLLRACGGLSVLATSREPLGLPGEWVRRVTPLEVPPAAGDGVAEDLADYEAVRLFVERGGSTDAGFRLTADSAVPVAEICRRLDGVPLAIELAAALLDVLSPAEIVAQLDARLELLTRTHASAAGHASLQAALDWSHNLLAEPEAALLRRLSVFAGGCTLDAIQVVCAGDVVPAERVVPLLSALVRKSLVITDRDQGATRYRLLETVRDYAARKLADAGETDRLRARHLRWCVALAEEGDAGLAAGAAGWLARLESEQGNLRAAQEFALSAGPPEEALRLGGALATFWWLQGHIREGSQFLPRALAGAGEKPSAVRAKALWARAFLTKWTGDSADALSLTEVSLALAESEADAVTRDRARSLLGVLSLIRSPAEALPLLHESARLARDNGDDHLLTAALTNLATALMLVGDVQPARAVLEECLDRSRRRGNRAQIASTLGALGQAAVLDGDYETAQARLEEGRTLAEDLGERGEVGTILSWQGELARRRGDYATARLRLEEGLGLARAVGRPPLEARCQCFLGWVARDEGDLQEARAWFEGSLAQSQRLGLSYLEARSALGRACVALAERDLAAAGRWLEQADRVAHAQGDRHAIAACARVRAEMARRQGPVENASVLGHEALILAEEVGDRAGLAGTLELLAALRNPPTDALRLFAAAQALRAAGGDARPAVESISYESDLSAVRDALNEADFDRAWKEGWHLSLDEAVTYARRGRGGRRRPTTGWASLTPAESDVARLAAQGLTNQEIGERLFVSRRTVGTHLAHVFTKLGITSRRQLASVADAATRGG